MKTILIILTLLGCDDSGQQCDVLELPEQAFETQEACMDAADLLLDRSLDEPYPLLLTQCATKDETVDYIAGVAPPEQTAAATRRLRGERGF